MPPPQPHQVRGADGQRCTPRTARAEQAIQITDGLLTASSCLSTIYRHPHDCLSRSTRTQAACQLLCSQSVAIPAMRCRRRVALHCFPPSSFNPSMLKGSQNAALGSRVRCVVSINSRSSEGVSRVCPELQSGSKAVYLCYTRYGWLQHFYAPTCRAVRARKRNVSFLQKRFPVTPTRNYNHSQLGCITPIDGRVKDVS